MLVSDSGTYKYRAGPVEKYRFISRPRNDPPWSCSKPMFKHLRSRRIYIFVRRVFHTRTLERSRLSAGNDPLNLTSLCFSTGRYDFYILRTFGPSTRGHESSSASKDPSIGLPRSPATPEALTIQPQPYLPRYRPHLLSFSSRKQFLLYNPAWHICGMSTVVDDLSPL